MFRGTTFVKRASPCHRSHSPRMFSKISIPARSQRAPHLGACFMLVTVLAAAGCAASGDDVDSIGAELIGGRVAEDGQFPATVALLTPLASFDTRYCIGEDRRCTMTRVGPRAYLAAGHCFADRNQLDNQRRVVLSPMFEPGQRVELSLGVQIWEYVEGTCPAQTFGNQIAVPAPGSQRVAATVRQVHFHPSFLARGAEAGEPGSEWSRFGHADLAILEVEEDIPGFAAQARVSFVPLHPGEGVVIAGHGVSGGFVGGSWSGLKYAARTVDALVGQDFFTKVDDPFGGPGIAPGDSGGGVFLAADPRMLTVVGVNSKSIAYRGSAHVRLDDGGPEAVRAWYEQVTAQIAQH